MSQAWRLGPYPFIRSHVRKQVASPPLWGVGKAWMIPALLGTIFPGDSWDIWEADKDACVIIQYHYSPQNSWRMKNEFSW